MKKALIISSVLLFFAVTTSAQTPTYKELSATAYRLLKEQDYIGAHKAFHTMDSLYGISDFEAHLTPIGPGQYSLDLTSRPQATYLLTLTTADGKQHTVRLLKQSDIFSR